MAPRYMSTTSSTPSKMSLTMWQKEQEWAAWWTPRAMRMVDDGSQSVWEKKMAVLREKKNWWFSTFGERYLTVEDKEEQWRNYWEGAHGEGSEPHDGAEKRQWWRQTFKEDPPLSARQIDLARDEEIAAARARNREDWEKDAHMGFYGPAAALAAALRHKAVADQEAKREPEAEAAMRAQVESMVAQPEQHLAARPKSLPRPPMENPVLFGCPGCAKMFPSRRGCDAHIEAAHCEGQAHVMFHPQATEQELKACLFVNLPLTEKAMLSPTVRSSDMDLCYVSKRLVLREPEEEGWQGEGH